MYRGYYISASGVLSAQQEMNVASNNLANGSTTGYKQDQEVFKAYPQMQLQRTDDKEISTPLGIIDRQPHIGPLNTGVTSDGTYTDFDQGSMKKTDNPLDVALQGEGFFVVRTQDGERFTRDGSFTVGSDGFLTTSTGRRVLGRQGPIGIPEETERVTIDESGQIYDEDGSTLGTLRVEQFENPQKMRKEGDSLFTQGENNPMMDQADDYSIRQGMLEQSNVKPIKEMTTLMRVSRRYEMNSRALSRQDELTQQAVRQVGRVG